MLEPGGAATVTTISGPPALAPQNSARTSQCHTHKSARTSQCLWPWDADNVENYAFPADDPRIARLTGLAAAATSSSYAK